MSKEYGIYVHAPWCRTRCPYCAFNVFLDSDADYRRWAEGISTAWAIERDHFTGSAHSLYFGGGTPSLAPPESMASLVADLSLRTEAEVTVEANPGTIQPDGLRRMVDAGVNRLSIGIQTFNPDHAKRLGRGHSTAQARQLVRLANSLGFRTWSMDLMFALPNQTEGELAEDLERIVDIGPPHISLYGLTIEPNTPFEAAKRAGTLQTPNAALWRQMYDRIVDTLLGAGWERYEVSNFARPGHRSVHNEAVWRGGHYAGLGPGAHGFRPNGCRTIGPPDLDEWLADPSPSVSTPAARERAIDFVLSTVRHIDGLDLTELRKTTGFFVDDAVAKSLQRTGAIQATGTRLSLTHEAFPIADGIVSRLTDALLPESGEAVTT